MAANFTYPLACNGYVGADMLSIYIREWNFFFEQRREIREDFFIFRREFILDYVCLDISNYFVDA